MSEAKTRDGRTISLRRAVEDDAADFIRAVDSVARENVYFLRSRFKVDEDWERAFIAQAAERGDLILVAVVDGELVGWVTLMRGKAEYLRHTAELGMGVTQSYRELGIGSVLMDWALHWSAEHGIEKVTLGVRASNERARALYSKFGFVEEGCRVREIKDPYGRYDDSVEMACFLSGVLPASQAGGREGNNARTP